jgi:heme exporter protein C
MKKHWWKVLCVGCLFYTITGGFLGTVPRLDILNETIRNLYFHVPMWFCMTVMFTVSMVYAIKYLNNPLSKYDIVAAEFANTGILFGILGIITGMIWAKFTWGDYWVKEDYKLNGAAISLLIYLAYMVLRSSFDDEQQRAKISAVYNIFAFSAMIPLIFILPRLTDSLHPGNGGNPGFNSYDLDNNMRMVFYPAVIGWILLGVWIAHLKVRTRTIEENQENLNA